MNIDYEILTIAILIAISCSIVGTFLVLRKMSMMADAISHTVLLGIVIAFAFVGSLDSPILIIGAIITGVITSYLIDALVKTRKIKEDASTGIVFPLLFSIAIIIISLSFRGTHLDVDTVLLGRIENSSIEQLNIFGINFGARKIYESLFVLLLNLTILLVFFKEFKIVSFDSAFSKVIGISPVVIHYIMMTQASITAVSAFDAVGSILVIALMVGPAISALLITKSLGRTITTAILISIFNSIVGYLFAIFYDVTISGSISVVTLSTFLIILFFNPYNGVVSSIVKRTYQKSDYNLLILLLHVKNHEKSSEYLIETNIYLINNELKWKENKLNKVIKKAIDYDYIFIDDSLIKLTLNGFDYLDKKIDEYNL